MSPNRCYLCLLPIHGNEVMVACARYYAVQPHDEIERRAFRETIWA